MWPVLGNLRVAGRPISGTSSSKTTIWKIRMYIWRLRFNCNSSVSWVQALLWSKDLCQASLSLSLSLSLSCLFLHPLSVPVLASPAMNSTPSSTLLTNALTSIAIWCGTMFIYPSSRRSTRWHCNWNLSPSTTTGSPDGVLSSSACVGSTTLASPGTGGKSDGTSKRNGETPS